ncbi:Kinase, NEK [Giardia muris]|uniref:non-specific serine/threonine protein kinase n=1 Tax=Giardia muris TaxID=5742 RepID=A0A4Z1T686_GIAMU|nr:Kinase, NEK [Giardia muris]|eukprot:TNJ28039.1 Kinase, NEK [Giardia muris]
MPPDFPKRFSVLEETEKSDFFIVYLVYDNILKREIEIKAVDLDRIAGTDIRVSQGLRREAELHTRLNNLHIVRCYFADDFEREDKLFLGLEQTNGSLKDELTKRRRKRPDGDANPYLEEEVWNYIVQITEGLKYLHDLDNGVKVIVHRDLKPENIRISEDSDGRSVLKIGGFSCARGMGGSTFASTRFGKTDYNAPETWQTNTNTMRDYSVSVDIWSLGCIAYELCTLKRPELLKTDQIEDLADPEIELPAGFGEEMRTFIRNCLRINGNERWTAEDAFRYAYNMVTYGTSEHAEEQVHVDVHKIREAIRRDDWASLNTSALTGCTNDEMTDFIEDAMRGGYSNALSELCMTSYTLGLIPQVRYVRRADFPMPENFNLVLKNGDVERPDEDSYGYVGEYKNARGRNKRGTALILAAFRKQSTNLHNLLCEMGHVVDGVTALEAAMMGGIPDSVMYLLPELSMTQLTPLMCYAAAGSTKRVRDLLLRRDEAKVGMGGARSGLTALMYAAMHNQYETVNLLIPYEVMKTSSTGATALMQAARYGNADVVRLLIPHEKRMRDSYGYTAFINAARGGHLEVMDELYEYEGDMTPPNQTFEDLILSEIREFQAIRKTRIVVALQASLDWFRNKGIC